MNKYPQLIIPGKVFILKNNPVLANNRVFPAGNIPKSTQNRIIAILCRQWGRPTITTPINLEFTFYVSKYWPVKGFDTSNAYQFYEDILQPILFKPGAIKPSRDGAGIIENDSLVMGHNNTKFVFLCEECVHGYTGVKKKSTKTMDRCPIKQGNKKKGVERIYCPFIKIAIEITDTVFEKMSPDEMKTGFTKNSDLNL